MDFLRASGLYDAPFPADDLLRDGAVDLSGFPNPDGVSLVEQLLALGDGSLDGFGLTSTLYFPVSGPLEAVGLPDVHESMTPDASVFLVDVDDLSPERGVRIPIDVVYRGDLSPFGPPGPSLVALPLQGVPMREGTRYALVVRTEVRDVSGYMLQPAPAVLQLQRGLTPPGLTEEEAATWRAALDAVVSYGTAPEEIAGLTVFTTGHPTATLRAYTAHARQHALALDAPPALTDTFDDYCVFESTLSLPTYQHGEPPFTVEGGGWRLDGAGEPELAGFETARIVFTVPRAPAPAAGWPTAVMIRTGAGGDRPLVDRGPRAEPGGEAIAPGTGLALDFAAAGYAGVSVDGPLGGLRNPSGADEQFLIFNVANPESMLGTLRESALELALLPDLLGELALDTSACPGGPAASSFDLDGLTLVGHSMGATIAPLTLAVEPRYAASVLSGAGGSWIANVVHKQSPLEVRPLAEAMLGYASGALDVYDPALALLQLVGEAADPPPYARHLVLDPLDGTAPRHLLVIQGVVDTYILPPMANALAVSAGLDLAGVAIDVGHPDLEAYRPLEDVLRFSGRGATELPAGGNASGTTAVVVQHYEDGVEDGHEVLFQRAEPRHQVRCFLADLADGHLPMVALPEGVDAACP